MTWMVPTSPHTEVCKAPVHEASELCVHSSWTHQAKSKLSVGAFKVNSSSLARKAANSAHSITWAQLCMAGIRCLRGVGEEGSLPSALVLLLHLPHGGFQWKLLPWQRAAEEEASGYSLNRTLFAGPANTKPPCLFCLKGKGNQREAPRLSNLQITPQCEWTLTEGLVSPTCLCQPFL